MSSTPESTRIEPVPAPAPVVPSDGHEPQRKSVRRRVADPRSAWLPPTRVAPGLRDKVLADAAAAGLSLGAYMRACLAGTPGPRAKRTPAADTVLLSKLLAELGKSGSNLNQIAHRLNIDETADIPELRDALREHRIVVAALMRALGV